MGRLAELNKDGIQLPSPPAIAVRILETVKKEEASYGELARIISADPALTAKVLKISNSTFYGLPHKITTIEKALSVLGVEVLKNIALSFVISKETRGKEGEGFDFDYFWKRAVTTAVGAELTAKLLRCKNDDIFVCSLLQDIGVLIMYYCRPHDYLRVLDAKKASGKPVFEEERRGFGFDHQEIGAELLESWGLPEHIYAPIRHHHDGDLPEEYRMTGDLLRWGASLSAVYHGSHRSERVQELKKDLAERFKLGGEAVDALVDSVAEKSVDILSSFEIDPGNMKPFSILLQEANDELQRMNLSYEQLVMEFKEAKEKAELLASELTEANARLRELAFRDGLTGLFNHRYFQELMDREMHRSVRYGSTLSLMMFDIDHFKRVNDSYGHPGGDIVLKTLAAEVQKAMRLSDIVARYGGEEFAVILPETNAAGGKVFAERLRRRIEQLEIATDSGPVKVTISIGLTTYEPGMKGEDKAAMIDAADRALYHSKENGRNKVSVFSLD